MSPADTLQTSVGPVPVLHRLALGVTVRDAITDRAARGPLRVGWEASGHLLPRRHTPGWPCVDFEPAGGGRFRLRSTPARPGTLTVRVDDPSRTYVPRRLGVTLWPHADLVVPPAGGPVPVASRTLALWFFPGAAYPLPRGATAVRGRVTHQGAPLPWVRVIAEDAAGAVLGRAHGDDRGEFLLVITRTNQNPVQSTVDIRLLVRGPVGLPVNPPVEPVPRPGIPPAPADLDNAVLRGRTPPPGHVPDTAPFVLLTLKVGEELVHTADIPFQP